MSEWPKPNWYLFNRVSLMPGSGIALVVAGAVEAELWLCLVGFATAAVGTWLTMKRLTGRISERSLAWVAIDTAVLAAGASVALALHLSGIALWVVVGIPAVASDGVATAFTGVKEADYEDVQRTPGRDGLIATPEELADADRAARAALQERDG
jgi:hypothetical protein